VAAADALSVIARALSFIGLFQAAGIAIFIALFGADLSRAAESIRRLGFATALVAIVFVLAHYTLQAARMGGELASAMDGSLQSLVLHSSESAALAMRVLGLMFLVVALRFNRAKSSALIGIGVVLTLLGFTAVGHTTEHAYRWGLAAVLLVHLIVVAFWFGALAPLYLLTSRESPATAARVVERFSSIAVWLVLGLALAGLALAVALLPNLAALTTPYGRLLLLKIIGFSLLLALAAMNKFLLGPALASGDVRAHQSFRRSLMAEYVLIAAVLAVTATLTTFYSPEG
jgi:copper resistance protein D